MTPKKGGGRTRRGRWSQDDRARLMETWGLRDDEQIARELRRPVASVRRMAEKLFPPRRRTGPWTANEIQELKRRLGKSDTWVIARVLGRTEDEVQGRIMELGRIQRGGRWTHDELAEFKRIYGTRSDEDLSRIFGRSEKQIQKLAEDLALAKDKAYLRKRTHDSTIRMPRWSKDEIATLERLYPTHSNLEIARQLGRSVKSIVSKAHSLGMKKDHARLKEMGRENVRLRYERD